MVFFDGCTTCFNYDIYTCMCATFGLFCFCPGVFFHSRATAACPMTTDMIMRVNVRTTLRQCPLPPPPPVPSTPTKICGSGERRDGARRRADSRRGRLLQERNGAAGAGGKAGFASRHRRASDARERGAQASAAVSPSARALPPRSDAKC